MGTQSARAGWHIMPDADVRHSDLNLEFGSAKEVHKRKAKNPRLGCDKTTEVYLWVL